VLFLFVVMMLDVKLEELGAGMRKHLPLGALIGVVMVVEMAFVIMHTWGDAGAAAVVSDDYNNARALGELMYTDYIYAVEIGAVILLVGMVTAISLTLRRRKDVRYNDAGKAVRVKAKDRVRLVDLPSQPRVGASSEEK
jgi:NADH-quinone oxidoreductase subunit J